MTMIDIDTKLGKLKNHKFSTRTGLAYYLVAYSDFPEVITDPATIKRMLDSGRERALTVSGAQLKNEADIKLGDHIGREWSVEVPGSYIATARAYWVRKRLYQTIIVMDAQANITPEAARVRQGVTAKFLGSFSLTEASKSH